MKQPATLIDREELVYEITLSLHVWKEPPRLRCWVRSSRASVVVSGRRLNGYGTFVSVRYISRREDQPTGVRNALADT